MKTTRVVDYISRHKYTSEFKSLEKQIFNTSMIKPIVSFPENVIMHRYMYMIVILTHLHIHVHVCGWGWIILHCIGNWHHVSVGVAFCDISGDWLSDTMYMYNVNI